MTLRDDPVAGRGWGAAPPLPMPAPSFLSSLGFRGGERVGRGAVPVSGPASAHCSCPSPASCWPSGFGQLTRPQFPPV